MNLRKWNREHTFGMLLGIITPMVFIPLVIIFLSWVQNYELARLFREFKLSVDYQVKILTISLISNLISFYYFLNRERFDFAMGIILGTIAFAPYVIYLKFF